MTISFCVALPNLPSLWVGTTDSEILKLNLISIELQDLNGTQ